MAVWGDAVEAWADIFREMSQRNVDRRTVRRYLSRFFGYGIPDFEKARASADHRATVLGCGTLRDDGGHVFELPLPPGLASQTEWRRLSVTLAWNSPINPDHQKYRRAKLWIRPQKEPLMLDREDVDWQDTERGTLQHVVMEGERAAVFQDGQRLKLQVNCRADAGQLDEPIPYALAVTLETREEVRIPIYAEIRARLQIPIRPPASTG